MQHLPLFLEHAEGDKGTLYGHIARANSQWRLPVIGEALTIFSGLDAYISPSWYAAKRQHGKVVPTWNYVAVHAYGPVEFFDEELRLRDVVTRLTDLHEWSRAEPWAATDAPEDYIRAQLKAIVGLRIPITRVEGKRKMSQNRSKADRVGVIAGLRESTRESDKRVSAVILASE